LAQAILAKKYFKICAKPFAALRLKPFLRIVAMGFLRRFVCGCGTKSLPIESPKYASCVPAALSPLDDGLDETWMPGRWACSSSPVDKAKKTMKHVDGSISEASTELPGAILESPSSSTTAVLPIGFNPELHRELPSRFCRAQTAPPMVRPRVTYFSDDRPVSSGLKRKPPPPLLMVGEPSKSRSKSPVAVMESDRVQKPWSH